MALDEKDESAKTRVLVAGELELSGRIARLATQQPGLSAAVVYYGTSPEINALAGIKAPVLGLYGENDARVNATIDAASSEMKKLGKTYQVEIFKGAGHAFLRAQSGQDGANLKAAECAWPQMLAFLRKYTS